MIKNIHIRNFQSHKDTTLELSPGVNAIVGTNSAGKSAVLRALYWVTANRPSGNAFRSWWGGDTLVGVRLEKDYSIVRAKSDKENTYTIEDGTKQVTEFKAFGTDVPEGIKNILALTDVNVQRQMDAPYLLSASPGEVARMLNKVVQLDEIDTALKNIARTLREEQNNLTSTEAREKELEEDLEQYKWLEEAEGRLVVLEALQGQIQRHRTRITNIQGMIESHNSHNRALHSLSLLLTAEKQVDKGIALFEEIKGLKAESGRLNNLINQIDQESVSHDKAESQIQKLQKELDRIMPAICPLCEQKIKRRGHYGRADTA